MSTTRGFIPVEIAISLLIIGILTALAYPRVACGCSRPTPETETKAEIHNIVAAEEIFWSLHERYGTIEELRTVEYEPVVEGQTLEVTIDSIIGWQEGIFIQAVHPVDGTRCSLRYVWDEQHPVLCQRPNGEAEEPDTASSLFGSPGRPE